MSDSGWSTPNQLSGSTPNTLSGSTGDAPPPDVAPGDPGMPPVPPSPTGSGTEAMPPAAAPVAKKRPAWRSGIAQIAVIAVIAIVALVFRDRLSGSASDLRVGDCLDEPTGAATEVKDVQHQPCNEQHDGEVFFVGNYPDAGAFPGRTALEDWAGQQCSAAFEAYVGYAYGTTQELDFGGFVPILDGWNSGDHEVTCYIVRVDHAKLMKSVKAGAS